MTELLDLTIRPVRLDDDREQLRALDRSFTTNRVYRITRTPSSFTLHAVPIDPPLYKDFPIVGELDEGRSWTQGFVAEQKGMIVGFVAITHASWNRRTAIKHLYVSPHLRGRRIGQTLINVVVVASRDAGTNCIWGETDNLAYPAIQFYRSVGFALCGLDESLYDPDSSVGGEIALFPTRVTEHESQAVVPARFMRRSCRMGAYWSRSSVIGAYAIHGI